MPQKIMLVEDDTNLSEIYKARLEAESYQVISAADGEQALALAVKEHPDLIISDVMMPKISGFDMLDILRGTEGIKDTKVIMMTALGQAEDKARADKLGADRYLVKSQVTLEDVVRSVHEVLGDENAATAPVTAAAPTQTATTPASTVAAAGVPKTAPSQPVQKPTPPQPNPALTVTQIPIASPPEDKAAASAAADASSVSSATDNTNASEQAAVLSQIQAFVNDQEAGTTQPAQQPKTIPRPSQTPPASPQPGQDVTNAPVTHDKVLEPPQTPEASLPKLDNSSPANDNVNLSDPSGISL